MFGSTEPGHVDVQTEDDDALPPQFQSDAGEFHTEGQWNVQVQSEDDDAAQFGKGVHTHEKIQSAPGNVEVQTDDESGGGKIKKLSELVCVVEDGEPKTRCAKNGTRRGRKRKM